MIPLPGPRALILAGGIALVALLGWLALPTLVASMTFFPARLDQDEASPGRWGLDRAEEVWMRASDGVRLHGWWIPARGRSCGAALYFHGNAGDLTSRRFVGEGLAGRGLDVLLFDYRGYGASEGTPDEPGLYRDGRAALEHLVDERGVDPERLVLVGHSLGTAVAVEVAAGRPLGGLVLSAPFTSLPDVAAGIYGSWARWPVERARLRFDAASKIDRVRAPVLYALGSRDEIIPEGPARRLYAGTPEPKTWVDVEGRGHNDLWDDEAWWDRLTTFLRSVTGCGSSSGAAREGSPDDTRAPGGPG